MCTARANNAEIGNKVLLYIFVLVLILYHTVLTFNNPKEEGFGKNCRKRRKCWSPAFSPFPTVFSILPQRKIIILAMFNLLSTNLLNLVISKILSFGKGLSRMDLPMTNKQAFENIVRKGEYAGYFISYIVFCASKYK